MLRLSQLSMKDARVAVRRVPLALAVGALFAVVACCDQSESAGGESAGDKASPKPQATVPPPSFRRSSDPRCEPEIDARLAAAALEQAEALIEAHGDHVSDGELRVILPLLRLAAHAGNAAAQRRYGLYVFGYWATDEMFWPKDPGVAVDALAMLHAAAKSRPDLFKGDELELGLHFRISPEEDALAAPQAWAKQAQAAAVEWERCRTTLMP